MTCILHLGIKLLLTLHHEIGRMWFSLPGINVQLDTEVSWDHVSIQLNRFRLGFEAPGNLGSLEAKEEKSGVGSHYSTWVTKSFHHRQGCPFWQVLISRARTAAPLEQGLYFLVVGVWRGVGAYSQVYFKHPAVPGTQQLHNKQVVGGVKNSSQMRMSCSFQGSYPCPFSDKDFQRRGGPKVTASKAQIGDLVIPGSSGVSLPLQATP